MAVCGKCNTEIAAGKTFCTSHYLEAQERYRQDFLDYQRRLQEWNHLSYAEKRKADVIAESSSVTGYAVLFGLIVGGAGGYFLIEQFSLDGLYGVLFAIVMALGFSVFQPLRAVTGRFMRALCWSLVFLTVLAVSIELLKLISKLVAENSTVLYYGAAGAALIISLVMEFRGAYHASAEPSKPSPPRP